MLMSETGTLSRNVLTEVDKHLKSAWIFPMCAELFNMFAKLISIYASKLEGCHCHAAIWRKKRKYGTRLKEVMEMTGCSFWCCWKGRQAAWFVAKGIQQLFRDLANCRSDRFNELLHKLAAEHQGLVLRWAEELATKLIEILKQKLSF